MNYGLSNDDIQRIQKILAHYPVVEKAIIYGSRAMGTYRNGSDIDLTLIGDTLAFSVLCKIEHDLDDLMLPYRIDLSILHQIDNPELLEHIKRVGKVFFVKSEMASY